MELHRVCDFQFLDDRLFNVVAEGDDVVQLHFLVELLDLFGVAEVDVDLEGVDEVAEIEEVEDHAVAHLRLFQHQSLQHWHVVAVVVLPDVRKLDAVVLEESLEVRGEVVVEDVVGANWPEIGQHVVFREKENFDTRLTVYREIAIRLVENNILYIEVQIVVLFDEVEGAEEESMLRKAQDFYIKHTFEDVFACDAEDYVQREVVFFLHLARVVHPGDVAL